MSILPAFVARLASLCFVSLCLTSARAQTPAPNLLPNASFESGPVGGVQEPYRGGGWSVLLESAAIPPLAARTESLDVQAYRDTQTPAAVGIASLRVALLAGRALHLLSPRVSLQAGKTYAVSLYLRADAPGTLVTVSIGNEPPQVFSAGPRWEQFSFVTSPPQTLTTSVEVRATVTAAEDRPVTLWIDGMQVEAGASASTTYQPAYPYELRATCSHPGHIFFDDEKISLDALIANGAPVPTAPPPGTLQPAPAIPDGVLRVSLLDTTNTVRKTITLSVPLDGKPRMVPVSLPDIDKRRPRGLFKARFELFASDGRSRLAAPSECVYARLPHPRTLDPLRSSFGVHIPLSLPFARIALATGNRWVRGAKATPVFSWPASEWEQDQTEFFDAGVNAVHQSGMATLGVLDGMPPWVLQPARTGAEVTNRLAARPTIERFWRRYVAMVAEHYREAVAAWEVANTLSNIDGSASGYSKLLQTAAVEAHRADDTVLMVGETNATGVDVLGVRSDVSDASPQLPAMSGLGQRVWNTEARLATKSFYGDTASVAQAQAAQIVRFEVRQRAAGIEKTFLYAVPKEAGDQENGLLESDRALSAPLAARAILAFFIDGAGTPTRTDLAPGVSAYAFPAQPRGNLPDNKTLLTVLWSQDGTPHLVPLPRGTQAWDIWGNSYARDKVTVGAEPIYLLAP